VDQLLDCTDVLAAPALVARLRPFYEQLAPRHPGEARREPGPRST
jgi:hypothetical protein